MAVRFGVEGAGEFLIWWRIVGLVIFLALSVLVNPFLIAGVLAFWQIAVPIWALAVGQIAWLFGAYAVGRRWRQLPLERRV